MNAESRLPSTVGMMLALILTAVFLFVNLGDRALWEDEAQTALLGRQVAQFGYPYFPSTINRPSDRIAGDDFNDAGVFVWNTWLPYYLVAGSFLAFGDSELSARLPFALFGLLSLWLYMRLCAEIFPRRPVARFTAVIMFIVCVPLLLHMRQARYYSLTTFGTMWMVLGYLMLTKGEKRGVIHVSLAGIVLFYSFYVVAFLNLAGLWVHAWWRERHPEIKRQLFFASVAIGIAALPFIVYSQPWVRPPGSAAGIPFTAMRVFRFLWVYLFWLDGFVFPLGVLAAAGFLIDRRCGLAGLASYAVFLAGASLYSPLLQVTMLLLVAAAFALAVFLALRGVMSGKQGEGHTFWPLALVFIILYVIAMAVVAPSPFYRYLVPVIPLALPIGAAIIGAISRKSGVAGVILLLLVVFSNLLSALPLQLAALILSPNKNVESEFSALPRGVWRWTKLRTDLIAFVGEISHHIPDPEEEIVNFIKKTRAKAGTIKASYGDIPLMYYLPDMKITPRLDSDGGVPDFIIVRTSYPLWQNDNFRQSVANIEYSPVSIPALDLPWSNNPDPLYHNFGKYPNASPLVVYVRKN